jgi:hypothetical protein
MPADTPEELRACVAADAQTSPSTYLADDSFAAWCYDHLSLSEVRTAFERDADPDECDRWGLTALEWNDCTDGSRKNECVANTITPVELVQI